mmetsp:Transcript_34777/g.56134  ORF Transcript_34777/g.56134 Transcript_34777/m.56134 type:complete len:137 (-) Transcript_34777:757-1167(-)
MADMRLRKKLFSCLCILLEYNGRNSRHYRLQSARMSLMPISRAGTLTPTHQQLPTFPLYSKILLRFNGGAQCSWGMNSGAFVFSRKAQLKMLWLQMFVVPPHLHCGIPVFSPGNMNEPHKEGGGGEGEEGEEGEEE